MKKHRCFCCLFIISFFAWIPSFGQITENESTGIYLIICSDAFMESPALADFIEFRNQDFEVQLVACTDVGISKDDFRDYVRSIMPDYLILVGAYGDFPVHIIPYELEVQSYNYYVASSLSGHPEPDIPMGLFFAESESELSNLVNKTISSENNFDSYPLEYYAHAGSNEPVPPWPLEFNEEMLTEMNDVSFCPAGYNFTMVSAIDEPANDVWTDINMINQGIQYMIYHGHGNIHKWTFGLGVGGLSQLNNTIYPFIFSFSCSTGTFSGTDGNGLNCFAQKIVADEHGAVAFLGAYNTSSKGMNQLYKGLVDALFDFSMQNRLGDCLVHGYANTINTHTVNKYYSTVTPAQRIRTAWQFHLFGDPALKIRELPVVWSGAVSNNWQDSGNWEGDVPSSDDVVLIPDVSLESNNYPVIDQNIYCGNLIIGAGASLTVVTGSTLFVEKSITLESNADLNIQGGIVLQGFCY